MSRDSFYVGASEETKPEDLHKFETGEWIAMPKVDGMWVRARMNRPSEKNEIVSRNSNLCGDDGVNGLWNVVVPQQGIVVVGELLAATEWATEEYARLGYRQIHLFDLAEKQKGELLYERVPWWERYQMLKNEIGSAWGEEVRKRLPIVPAYTSGFLAVFEKEVKEKTYGGEGIMLWRKSMKIVGARRADGKVLDMVKCKNLKDKSYVLVGTARTKKGNSLTGRWGLFDKNGKMIDVMQAGIPGVTTDEEAAKVMGRVADFQGFEVFRSGAMRSASFLKWREDIEATECKI